jgi:hypothetical protein
VPGLPDPRPQVRGGYLDLVNPDADRPDDEGIPVVTPSPGYDYYVCGVTPPALSGNPTLPKGRGWINFVEGDVIPGFIALRSRNRLPGNSNADANFEGGIWTEGEAASGKFFFVARAVEPWIPGRHGNPGSDPKYRNNTPLFDGKAPTKGQMTGMYQWLQIKHLMQNKPSDSDLVIQATVLRRSLYTDRSMTTGMPDQGRISLDVFGDDFYKGYNTRFEPGKDLVAVTSERFPSHDRSTAELTLSQVERSRTWVLQATPEVVVPDAGTAVLIGLVGIWQSAYDVDAYFDNVIVRWDYRKKAA